MSSNVCVSARCIYSLSEHYYKNKTIIYNVAVLSSVYL